LRMNEKPILLKSFELSNKITLCQEFRNKDFLGG